VFNDVAVIQQDMGYRSFDTEEEELAKTMVRPAISVLHSSRLSLFVASFFFLTRTGISV